jgi:hypothetical protein
MAIPAEINLMTMTVLEEIAYARQQVSQWIYNEYRQIAEAAGFDRIPKVRWDNSILRDIILYMSTIAQLVDRRMISYNTALEELNFNYPNELANMEEELPLVLDGIFGILGSPFQKSAGNNVQPTQNSPTGTPSSGRPKAQPAKPKQKKTDVTDKTKQPNQAPSQQPKPAQTAKLEDIIKDMSELEYAEFIDVIASLRTSET